MIEGQRVTLISIVGFSVEDARPAVTPSTLDDRGDAPVALR